MAIQDSDLLLVNRNNQSFRETFENIKDEINNNPPTDGQAGHWDRTGTVVSPTNAGDTIATDDNAVQLVPGTTGSPLVRDANGNLGVGIAAPPLYNANLRTVSFNGTNGVVHDYAVNGTRTGSIVTQATGMQLSTQTATPIIFTTDEGGAGGEAARLDPAGVFTLGDHATPAVTLDPGSTGNPLVRAASGNVGVGRTPFATAGYPLQLRGATQAFISLSIPGHGDGALDGFVLGTDNTRAYVTQREDAPLTFSTNNAERMRLNNAGVFTLGDGTTNAVTLDPGTAARPLVRDSAGRLLVGTASNTEAATLVLQGNSAGSPASIIRLKCATNAPADGAQISVLSFCDSSNGDAAVINVKRDGGTWTTGSSTPTRLSFSTTPDGSAAPLERMRLSQAGGGYLVCDSGTNNLIISNVEPAGGTFTFLQGRHSGVQGSVASGTVSINIMTNGDIANTNNAYGAISDIKLKENIVDAKSQWDDIKALRLVNYNFKAETGAETNKQLGLIAQEVEKVCPGLVGETKDTETVEVPVLDDKGVAVMDEDGKPVVTYEERETGEVTKNVAYSVLYMKAVGALQEAMQRIEQLEAKNTQLEAIVVELAKKVA